MICSDLRRTYCLLWLRPKTKRGQIMLRGCSLVFFLWDTATLHPQSLAPEHRVPILTSALKANPQRAELALKGFDQALSIRSITRFGGDPPFRLKKGVERWRPKTYGEWFDAYRLYLHTLQSELKNLPGPLQQRAIGIILSHARELLAVENLSGDALDTIVELAQLPQTDRRKIIAAIQAVLKYEKEALSPDTISRLASLRDEIVGTSFHSRLERYAGMDLLEDQLDQDGNLIDRTAKDVRKLAEEVLAEPRLLRGELGWLITQEAKNGYRFGYALGQLDNSLQVWPEIREAYLAAGSKSHDYFLGGYLRAVFDRAPQVWETIIEELADDGRMQSNSLPGLVWRSGMSDKIAALILGLVQSGKASPQTLSIFGAGRATDGLSDATFAKWLEALTDLRSFSASATALHLASMSILSGRSLTREQLEQLLTQPALLEADGHYDVMLSHYWLQLSHSIVKLLTLDKLSNSCHITAAGFRRQGCGHEQKARSCRTGSATFRGGAFTPAWYQAGGGGAAAPSEPHVGVAVGTSA